jgi:inhibitor of cysteine peptidase
MKNYFAVSAAVVLVFATAFFMVSNSPSASDKVGASGVDTFGSEQEFREYVSSSPSSTGMTGFASDTGTEFQAARGDRAMESASAGGGGSTEVSRYSSTNVQVEGVSEPDILKNTGEKIFYSGEQQNYYYNRDRRENATVFRPLPAENFSEVAEMPESGRMLLGQGSVIFLGDSITSYSRESYEEEWNLELNSSSITAARKINSTIYLVLEKNVDVSNPCPVRPMASISIPCTDFYRPSQGEGSTQTYNIVKVDAEEGEVDESTGFVGSGWNTVVYMSEDSIYLTYMTRESETEVLFDFIESEGDQFFDDETMNRLEEIQTYNLSDQALQVEMERTLRDYMKTLSEEERRDMQDEFQNAWGNYTSDRKRELSTTGIAEFNTDLELEAEGSVPGKVNDQFSLSEKDGNFRIATTVVGGWQFDAKSANDLYVLDENLDRKGNVQGMGLTERIYSVRYLNDQAYVVTFRRVDPFHVVDLSEPENPEVTGKLKLPGFSSYLHPLSDDRILGIGEEDGQVKAVIFDVSEEEPTIQESKVLDDWYSSISESHHAFKIDRKHEVFFLPGSSGGHVFNYSEGLEQVKKVEMSDVKRATYVNDYLYVLGDTNAAVVDEKNWETVKEIQFGENTDYSDPVTLPGPVVR